MTRLVAGDFEWGRVLGEGSYGEVVLARLKDPSPFPDWPTEFAVKKLSKRFILKEQSIMHRTGRDVQKQCFTEKNLLSKLSSPFIVSLFTTFTTTEELFYAISYQDQGDLRELLNEKGALEVNAARFYLAELLSALFYLHDNLVIHRDIKPENILLGKSESGVHLKLCDFATAKDVTTLKDGERASTFVGSAEYVSPELLGYDEEVGKYAVYESDLWAAASVVYFTLAGLPPFRAESEYLMYRKIETNDYSFPEGFHEEGKTLVKELLQLKPCERLGAGRNHSEIKNHPFFKEINWTDLHKQEPPTIRQYSDSIEEIFHEDPMTAAFEEFSVESNQASKTGESGEQISEVDDPTGLGIPTILSKAEFEKRLVSQRIDRKNKSNRWATFVDDDELIIKLGYMYKKRGLFSRKRMFLLTGGKIEKLPRLIYVDANSWEKKGEINLHGKIKVHQKSFSRFYIIDPSKGRDGRIYDLTDNNSNSDVPDAGAAQWIRKIQLVKEIYFSKPKV